MIASKYNIIVPANGANYVFNLASQCLVEINEDLERYLSGSKKAIDLTEDEREILYANGILADSHEFELARLKSNVNSLKHDNSKYGVFISTTAGCNLNCTYCYQDRRKKLCEKKYITPENWNIMLKHFKVHIKKHGVKHFGVSLFGGEPMYDADMCQTMVDDLRELERETENLTVQIVIITNGTLFTKENVDFFMKNLDIIQITLDGVKDIHDKLRVHSDGAGSFDEIITNLKLISESQKHLGDKVVGNVCVRVNVNNETVDEASKLVDYLVEEKLHECIGGLAFHEIFGTQEDVIESGADSDNKDIQLAKRLAELNFYVLSKGIPVYKEISGPCIAKMSMGYAIDEDLNVYGCPGIIYSEIHGKLLEDGEIMISDKKWYDYHLNDPKCINACKYAPICYGGCNWASGQKEKDCMKDIHDVTIVPKLQAYVMSNYAKN